MPMLDTDKTVRLATYLLILASTCGTGAQMASRPGWREQHLAQLRAYLDALRELEDLAPGILQCAAEIVDRRAVDPAIRPTEFRATLAVQLANHLLANLRFGGAKRFDDGVEAFCLNGQESSALAAPANGAADGVVAHTTDGATPAAASNQGGA